MQSVEEPEVETGAAPDPSSSQSTEQRKPDYQTAGKRLMDKCVRDAQNNTARLDRDKQDWLNLLYERGGPDNQYVIWDAGTNTWVTRGSDPKKGGLPEWMPRPVTNIYANKISGIVALLNQSQPAQLWKPNTDDDADIATAEVADNALPVLYDEIDYDALRPEMNRQVTLTDKVALLVYYDNDPKHGTEPILALQCQDCQQLYMPMDLDEEDPTTCPECGGPVAEATDPQGMPVGVDYPVGKMCARLHMGFEFSLPSSARTHRAEHNPWILFHSRYSWEESAAEWSEHKEKFKEKGGGWSSSSIQRHYADAMRRLASPRSTKELQGSSAKGDGPIVYRLYHDPIDDGEFYFPQGFMGVLVNDELVEAGPLPFKQRLPSGEDKYFKNVVTRTFRATPGSPFGKPPADDLVPLQYTRNLLEALLMAILLHHASPRTYLPLSVTLEKMPTGTPGEVIPYRSTTPGEAPITTQGTNPPEGLYKWIEQVDAKFDELSNLNAVLQGERPAGDPTLGEIEILKERGESAFSEPLLELVRAERQLSRMLLWIARDTLWTDRLRQVQGENGSWEITQFNAGDLSGNVDVQIDAATAWPKSPLMRKLQFKEAMEMQVFQMMQVDPELAMKVLEFMDLTEFKPSFDVDRKQVMRKLDRWKAAHSPQEIAPPDEVTENLPFHLQHLLNFMKTEEVEALQQANPPLYMAMRTHVQQIQVVLALKAAQAAAAQAGGSPPGEGEKKPDGAALDAALSSGALQPAGAGGGLDAAIQQGALVPADAALAQQPQGPSIDDLIAQGAMLPAQAAEMAGGGANATGMPGL